jgi:hypothetical protein
MSDDTTKMETVYMHWDDGEVIADNSMNATEAEANNDKPYMEITCKNDEFRKPAEFVTEENGNLPYTGPNKPDFDRCFFIPYFDKSKKKKKDYYCAMGDLDGEEEWDTLRGSLAII